MVDSGTKNGFVMCRRVRMTGVRDVRLDKPIPHHLADNLIVRTEAEIDVDSKNAVVSPEVIVHPPMNLPAKDQH
jgi:hypothetical protein